MSLKHILVGLCREPSSGYDLKALFDHAIRYFWSAELSQIYPTLHRLEASGMLEAEDSPSTRGPKRRLYRTTAAGRRMLQEWLKAGPAFRDERYVFAAQIFFLDELDDLDATADFIHLLETEFERRRDALAAVDGPDDQARAEDLGAMDSDEFHHYLTLRMGLRVVEARIAWCNEALHLITTRRGNA